MNTKETIRAEIERQMKYYDEKEMRAWDEQSDEDALWYQGHRKMCSKLLAFIDTLPEQVNGPSRDQVGTKFAVEGLEEEMFKEWGTTKEEYLAKSMYKVHLEMEIATYLQDWEDDDEIGLHLSTDEGCMPIELEDIRDLARHFAEWQKKRDDLETADLLAIAHLQGMEQQKSKMLEDAVEGEVTTDNRGNNVVRAGVFNKDFEYGDKVRVIVINED